MVCNRCIWVVQKEMERLGYTVQQIRLGEVEAEATPAAAPLAEVRTVLEGHGFEWLDDQRRQVIEKIKVQLIELIHQRPEELATLVLSDYLSQALHRDYSTLSRLFSETEGNTIEQFFILQRIERAKELLVYGDKTLSEVAWQLGYSSVAHLSGQFKKVTGLTATAFRQLGGARKGLDEV